MLREDQVSRYARHVLLPDMGGRGQARLLAGAVRVSIRAGDGAAVAALAYLAAAGVGRLELCGAAGEPVTAADVESGILYAAADVGRPRAAAIAERIAAINPDVTVAEAPDVTVAEAPADPAAVELVVDVPAADVAGALIRGGTAAAAAIETLRRADPS